MRFDAAQAAPVPWKNGGGTTRELAVQQAGGRMAWRLSLADIGRDGPFSGFPGLMRIHTIVAGNGLRLSNDSTELQARPLQPLHFDGGLALMAQLADGPCRALNVIYDPELVAAEARVLRPGAVAAGAGGILFVLEGKLDLGPAGRFGPLQGLVLDNPAAGTLTGGLVVRIRFTPRPAVR